jgi:hypothetical protein
MIRKHTQRAEESADAGEDEDVSEDEMTHTAQQADHRE